MKKLFLTILALVVATNLPAAIQTKTVEYKQGDTTLAGVIVYDDAVKTPRPGVLIVHQWMGITEYEKTRASMLAKLGY
ncbi:MAG: dienelactone hydrolase family protein, partial [Verrucomicrobiota bacterium]